MVDYQGRNISIIGLGLTGFSCINFFLSRGITPKVMDTRVTVPSLDKLPKGIKYYLGGFNNDWLFSSDLIIVSPGISLFHPVLIEAAKAGIEIIGDIELFCREAKAPIVAITGSNGKSTVTTLIGEMAKIAGINVAVGGNIGLPILSLLDPTCELYVLELSSFQLESTFNLKSIASTILNITLDHRDRYPFGLKQYQAAKLRVYKNSNVCVINADDPLTIPKCNNKHFVSFGINIGDYFLHRQRGETWLCIRGERVLNVKEMLICGQHNYVNALASLALADILKLPRISNLKVLSTFTGLAHRFQLVLECDGIRWINDSKATNIAGIKAGINALQIKGTLHLLLGGDGKSADFTSLKSELNKNEIRLYCFGSAGGELAALCPEISEQTETLQEAMYLLASRVKSGDVVLLSPGCSSFDQFNNFEHRGLVFSSLVKKIAQKR